MAEFNVPLSLILELAANQAGTYFEDCRYMSGKVDPIVLHGMPKRKKIEYEEEMKYWNQVFVKLIQLQEKLKEDDIDFIW